MLLLHKTSLEGIVSRSCVVTEKKCTKECTARVELSLGSLSGNDGDGNKNVTLRACLHGVGDPGLVGLVSFVFTLWGTQNKRNLPH